MCKLLSNKTNYREDKVKPNINFSEGQEPRSIFDFDRSHRSEYSEIGMTLPYLWYSKGCNYCMHMGLIMHPFRLLMYIRT